MAKTTQKSLPTPTEEQFNALNKVYQYFNRKLFGNQLPGCILNFSRLLGTHGFLAPERWKRVGEKEFGVHEISLTPTPLFYTPLEIFSTLVYEMCHLWQRRFGKPSRNGYHNKEWADSQCHAPASASEMACFFLFENTYFDTSGKRKRVYELLKAHKPLIIKECRKGDSNPHARKRTRL